MKAEGFKSLYDQERLAVRGFAEVVRRLPEILRIRRGLVRDLLSLKPDVFVGISMRPILIRVWRRRSNSREFRPYIIISPSVWAWRRERVGKIVHQVNRVQCLFPMEPQLYLDAGGRAEFIGHPMAQLMPLEDDRETARKTLGVDAGIPVFALLPGNRVSEIDDMAQVCFQTALLLLERYPAARFLLPAAAEATKRRLAEGFAAAGDCRIAADGNRQTV